MRTKYFVFSVFGATLISAGVMTAHAQEGFYDPSNVGSPTGKTTGYELYKTIGCPGQALLGTPCKAPAPAAAPVPAPAPAPIDSDGDGVVDGKDKCPGTPAGRKVNADGCELDSDGDGVVDGLDKCPGTPAGRKVNADGCELDGDGDGIVDGNDKCPTIYAKTADGCPPPLVLEGVQFDNNKATLRPEAFAILDKTAVGMKDWGNVKIEVAGHTDSVDTDEHNMKLSQQRAETVRDYLISKGIAGDRLTAKGYGESKPIADNETEEGRFKNRRVELLQTE
jgi:outer membrane protein OmpA-like peptidoglycan-associated protein